jgi:branched-chain amino acid transport system ATP-binding protein
VTSGLQINALRAGYGAINVLWDVDLEAAGGKLTAIIGPNGAGKTTLLRAVMGLIPSTQGAVAIDGVPLPAEDAWRRVGRGMALIPEGRMIFVDMSVEENLILGGYATRTRGASAERLERAYAMFPRLAERRRQVAGSLSGGEAQMLSMARGLMSDPKLVLIDEPSLGLAPVMVNEIFALLERLKQDGRTLVLVEQNTARAIAVADEVCLMVGGRIVSRQPARDVNLEALHETYFAS